MIPVWLSIQAQVKREHLVRAAKPPTGRDQLAQEQAKGAGSRAADVHRDARRRPPPRSVIDPRSLARMRADAASMARSYGAMYVIVVVRADGVIEHATFPTRDELRAAYARLSERHDTYRYIAAFDFTVSGPVIPGVGRAPVVDAVGVPAAEHAEVPVPTPPAPPPTAEVSPPAPPEVPTAPPVEPEKPKTGLYIGIGAAVVAAIGIGIAATRGRKSTPPRSRGSRVIVTGPARTLRT